MAGTRGTINLRSNSVTEPPKASKRKPPSKYEPPIGSKPPKRRAPKRSKPVPEVVPSPEPEVEAMSSSPPSPSPAPQAKSHTVHVYLPVTIDSKPIGEVNQVVELYSCSPLGLGFRLYEVLRHITCSFLNITSEKQVYPHLHQLS